MLSVDAWLNYEKFVLFVERVCMSDVKSAYMGELTCARGSQILENFEGVFF